MGKDFRAPLCGAAAALALAGLSGGAQAETLADALRLAYQTNPTLQSQRAQLRYTDETYVQAKSGFRPTATAQAQGQWSWQKIGTTCSVFGCQSVSSNELVGQLTVTQPIYTGGRVTASVNAAAANIMAGRETLRRIEGQVMLGVIQAYVDVRRDEQALKIRQENVTVLRRQVEETRARFEVGEVTRTDVAQAEAQLAQSQSDLSAAFAQLAVSRAEYAAAVGQSPQTLEPEPAFKVFPTTVDQAFDTAQQNSPGIRAADYNEQAAGAQVSAARAQRLPTVGVQASFGYFTPISPFDTSQQNGTLTTSVIVNQPIFSGGLVSSQIRQAIEQQNYARIQLEQARRQSVQDLSQAWNQLLAARAAVAAQSEQVRAASIAAEGSRAEQEVGLRTTLEVLTAEEVLRNAELLLVNARHDEYLASASVLNVMGLLEARDLVPDIELQPGSHTFTQLKHAPGYVPGLDEAVSTIDSIGKSGIKKLPPPLDAPIATGQAAEARAAGVQP